MKEKLPLICHWLLVAIAATLPQSYMMRINTLLVIAFTVAWFFYVGHKAETWKKTLSSPYFWVLSSIFWACVSVFWLSNDLYEWGHSLERRVSFLIFPLLLIAYPASKKQINHIIQVFVISLTALALFTFPASTYIHLTYYPDTTPADWFTSQRMVQYIKGMHRVYMAYHVVFAVMVLWLRPALFVKKVRYGLIVFLTLYAILLASRNLTVFLFLFYGIMILLNIKSFWQNKKLIAATAIALVGIVFLISRLPLLQTYITQMTTRYNVEEVADVEDTNGVRVRQIIWSYAWELIKEKPITGYGIPNGQQALENMYVQKGFTTGIQRGYHAHNLYLAIWLESGLLGIMSLLATLFFPLFKAVRENKKAYVALVVLTIFACITEPVIYLHQGIIMFTLFVSLLLFENKRTIPEHEPANTVSA